MWVIRVIPLKLQFLLFVGMFLCDCDIEFDREYVGVEFSPYVKKAVPPAPLPSVSSYTFEHVKTMLEVVSTRFSRVMTRFVGVFNDIYVPNETYYYDSSILARTAEAAAVINRERQKKSLTVLIGMFDKNRSWNHSSIMKTEVSVALEAVQIANSIYPGTVEGIFFSNHDIESFSWANSTLTWIKTLRNQNQTSISGVKIGTKQICDGLSSIRPEPEMGAQSLKIWELRKEIVQQSDFVICQFQVENGALTPRFLWAHIRAIALMDVVKVKSIKEDIDVMLETSYYYKGINESVIGELWMEANAFASTMKHTVWLNEAFDNPIKAHPDKGWWKLTRNELINSPAGFVEKITGKPVEIQIDDVQTQTPTQQPDTAPLTPMEDATDVWDDNKIIFGVAIAAVLFIIIMIVLLYFIISKCQRKPSTSNYILSRREIHEFKHGFEEDEVALVRSDYDNVNISALKLPYKKSLEISKRKLEILRDQVLGQGQYGLVCKAIIKGDSMDTDTEVALKMLKHDSPSTALKGFLSEIKILTYLGNHPNIVPIVGACTTEISKGVVYIATELCASFGSLDKHLQGIQNTVKERSRSSWNKYYANAISFHDDIPYKDMIRWSYEIACGMEYLGEKNIVFMDLAARNVLLSSDGTAKLTDFGLSRRLYDYQVYTKQNQEPLPWRSMALESLKRAEFSAKSDVWSYGVILWEIYSLGDMPYPGHSCGSDFVENLENGFRLNQPHYAGSEIYKIMRDCWKMRPEDRPTFIQLKELTRLICETYLV